MSRLRLPINAVAVLAIAVTITRMMQNPMMWSLLERPVLGLGESLNMHGHENIEDLFVYMTMFLGFLIAFTIVTLTNRLIVRAARK